MKRAKSRNRFAAIDPEREPSRKRAMEAYAARTRAPYLQALEAAVRLTTEVGGALVGRTVAVDR